MKTVSKSQRAEIASHPLVSTEDIRKLLAVSRSTAEKTYAEAAKIDKAGGTVQLAPRKVRLSSVLNVLGYSYDELLAMIDSIDTDARESICDSYSYWHYR